MTQTNRSVSPRSHFFGVMLSALLSAVTVVALAAPVQVAPGGNSNYRFFDRLSSATGSIRSPGTNDAIPLGSSGCSNLPVNWTVGANSCSGNTGVTTANNTKGVTSTNANSGIGNFKCSGTTYDYTYVAAGSTCAPPPPTTCTAQSLSWTVGGTTCSGPVNTTSGNAVVNVPSTSANSGTGNFTCAAGTNTYTVNTGSSTCAVPAPANCTDKAVSWSQGANSCSVQSGITPNGSSKTVSSSNGLIGSASVTCNSPTDSYAVGGGATCYPANCTSQTQSWTVSGNTCTGPSGVVANTTSKSVTSTNTNVGAGTFTCNSQTNTFAGPAPGATCSLPAPTTCTNKSVSWTQGANTCSSPSGVTNDATSKTLSNTAASKLGSATVSCAAGSDSYSVQAGATCYADTCADQVVTWTSGANSCTANSGTVGNGTNKALSSTNANTGTVTATCNSQTNTFALSGQTCSPPPANCGTTAQSWTVGGVTCSGTPSGTTHSGTKTIASVNGNNGNATYTCNDGSYINPTGTTCSAPPPVNCTDQALSWTVSGNTCSAQSGATNTSTSKTLTSTSANTGNATFACTNGTYSQQGGATCNPASPYLSGVKTFTGGRYFSCAILDNGALKCWGKNDFGQLGDGTTTNRNIPTQVTGLTSGVSAIQTAISYYNSTDLTNFSCAIHNGALKCWGINNFGQLGDGTTTNRSVPTQVTGLTSGVSSIWLARDSACAIHNGALKCWGKNDFGQLGDGTTTNRNIPTQVTGLTSGVNSVVSNGFVRCAILVGDGVKCWGYNGYSQVGDGTNTDRYVPTQVTGLTSGVTSLLISYQGIHSCAIHNDGVKCWGYNADGQVGNGTTTNRNVPTQVTGLTSGVSRIATGNNHSCALQNGGVKCWGSNYYSHLGDGTSTSRSIPTQVSGLTSGVVELFAYGINSSAILSNGSLVSWGGNFESLLGITPYKDRSSVPVVTINSGVLMHYLLDFGSHTCALMNNYTLKCWGSDVQYGSTGTGETSCNPSTQACPNYTSVPKDVLKGN